jgi:hypothetical protein
MKSPARGLRHGLLRSISPVEVRRRASSSHSAGRSPGRPTGIAVVAGLAPRAAASAEDRMKQSHSRAGPAPPPHPSPPWPAGRRRQARRPRLGREVNPPFPTVKDGAFHRCRPGHASPRAPFRPPVILPAPRCASAATSRRKLGSTLHLSPGDGALTPSYLESAAVEVATSSPSVDVRPADRPDRASPGVFR